MAFTANTYFAGNQANGAKISTYTSAADDLATVKGSGYFDDAALHNGLKNGDFVLAVATDGESMLYMAVAGDGTVTVSSANDFA